MKSIIFKISEYVRLILIFLSVSFLLNIACNGDKPNGVEPIPTIEIADPVNGAMKPQTFTTSGQCTDVPDECCIWLVVLPDDNENLWYPQKLLSSSKNGNWSSNTIIGREGDLDKGKKFTLFAMIVKKEGALGIKLECSASSYLNADPENQSIKAHHQIYVISE